MSIYLENNTLSSNKHLDGNKLFGSRKPKAAAALAQLHQMPGKGPQQQGAGQRCPHIHCIMVNMQLKNRTAGCGQFGLKMGP